MPNVLPCQTIRCGRRASAMVEVILPGPDFQRKTKPCASSPESDLIALTSGFHSGHRSKSVNTSQTLSAGAPISISLALAIGPSTSRIFPRNASAGAASIVAVMGSHLPVGSSPRRDVLVEPEHVFGVVGRLGRGE